MATTTKKDIPALRFPGFKDEWEDGKFGDIYQFFPTNSLSRDKLNYTHGEIYNIHYGDIHTKFQTLFKVDKENVPFIDPGVNVNNIKEVSFCQEQDIVIADASENYDDIGKAIEIYSTKGKKIVAGLHTFLARPNTKIAKGFGGYMFKSPGFHERIKVIAQGTKVLSISSARLSLLPFRIPHLKEQQKIASFLSSVDERLQQLQQQQSLLEQYKQSCIQQLFNQKLRLKNEKGKAYPEWKEVSGGDAFDNISNKEHNSDLPILAITQEFGAIPRDLIDYNVLVSDKSIESYKVVEVGDFIISLRSFQGGIEYSNYKGICSPAYIILRPSIEIDRRFFKYYFKTSTYIQRLTKKLEGIRDGKMISYKYFSEVLLPLPSLEEQIKIANFLSSIDEQINTVKQQIAQTQQFKKGLLQQMFV